MQNKETASERQRQRPTMQAPTAALKHTSVKQQLVPALALSAVRQIARDAAIAATNATKQF